MHAGVQITFTTFSVRRLLHEQKWYRRRKRLLEILEVGNDLDLVSRAYDFFSAFAIVLNLTASIMYTFDNLQAQYGSVLLWIERITVAFFALDYVLRLFTARISYEDDEHINLKEVVLKTHNPWTGLRIRDLDISRQSIIVLVKRRNKSLIPNGNMKLEAVDRVFIYTKLHLSDANNIEI